MLADLGADVIRVEKPGELAKPAPLPGQDTEYVRKKVLGMNEEEYVNLLLAGAFE